MNRLANWLNLVRKEEESVAGATDTMVSQDARELRLPYRQFREQFPLARVVFEEPMFLSIASGVQFLPKIEEQMQQQLARSGYEEALKEAWIANLSKEERVMAFNLDEQYWQVVTKQELKRGPYDVNRACQFKPYEISKELKRLVVWHHKLLVETGVHMAKNSAKTILTIKGEQNGYNVQEQKERAKLAAELANYTSDKVLLTSNGTWSTVSVNTAPLLEIRRNILQSIASITAIPMEILEQSGSSSVFTGESDSSRRYKNIVRALQQAYLYPMYLLSLESAMSWSLVDPFATSLTEKVALEKERQSLIAQMLANQIQANAVGIDLSTILI